MVSDRAVACPECAFPIAEELRLLRAREELEREAQSRQHVGEVDCPACVARGFRMVDVEDQPSQSFEWCRRCERSGRCPLVQSHAGFFAVSFQYTEEFLAGAGVQEGHVTSLGGERPVGFRYPQAGPRVQAVQELEVGKAPADAAGTPSEGGTSL